MATSRDTVDYLLAQLEPLPVRVRAMFGEYALYCDDKVVGFICDNTVFLKPSPVTSGLPLGPCYEGSKDYAIVADAMVDSADAFQALVLATAEFLPVPKPKKSKAPKG